jgi:hypothetical protein
MPIRVLPNGHCHSCPQPGRHQSERLVVINRNAWSSSIGPGGRHQSEPVVAINWRGWSPSIGTGGRHQPVYACYA